MNLRILKISTLYKNFIVWNVWVRIFAWNFKGTLWNSTQNILPINLKDMHFIHRWIIKSKKGWAHERFWNAPWCRHVLSVRRLSFITMYELNLWISSLTAQIGSLWNTTPWVDVALAGPWKRLNEVWWHSSISNKPLVWQTNPQRRNRHNYQIRIADNGQVITS